MKKKSKQFNFDPTFVGLQTFYSDCKEIVRIPMKLLKSKSRSAFLHAYNDDDDCYQYKVSIKRDPQKIHVIYDKNANEKVLNKFNLKTDDFYWGQEIYHLNKKGIVTKVEWEKEGHSPEKIEMKYFSKPQFKRSKKSSSSIARKQSKFRNSLIKTYKCCAITGCNVEEALEAAHILPAVNGGPENVFNGILLRKDLHSLFDAGLLTINNNRTISFKQNVLKGHDEYKKYVNFKISKDTFDRIKDNLHLRKKIMDTEA